MRLGGEQTAASFCCYFFLLPRNENLLRIMKFDLCHVEHGSKDYQGYEYARAYISSSEYNKMIHVI